MTQNTIENKARFHALYWGQKVFVFNDEGQYKPGVTYEVDGSSDEHTFLELRSLPDITDEEATAVAKIWEDSEKIISPEEYDGWTKEVILDAIPEMENVMLLRAADYLRSRGFLLPYLDLSIEQILEYGWARIKSQP